MKTLGLVLCVLLAATARAGQRTASLPRRPTSRTSGGAQLRPPIEDVLPGHFGFGVSAFGRGANWPEEVKASHGVRWDFLYRYYLWSSPSKHWTRQYLNDLLTRADRLGAIPVITYYQVLHRGQHAGLESKEEWDVVIRAVQDPEVMRGYFDDVKRLMEGCAAFGKPVIFESEPDTWAFWMLFHTDGTYDARRGAAAVASSGHPDVQGFPDNIAGVAQALVHLRDLYAPANVYMGLCAFNFRGSANPQHTVTFVKSMDAAWDVLFEKVLTYSDPAQQKAYLRWLKAVTSGTGLKYLHWQITLEPGAAAALPDYPADEHVSELVEAGSVGAMFELLLGGPGDSAERLKKYYKDPRPWRRETRKPKPGPKEKKPIILPDGTEIIIVGGIPIRRKRKGNGKALAEPAGPKAEIPKPRPPRMRRPRPKPEGASKPEKPREPPELVEMFKRAESLFIDGDSDGAAELFRKIVAEHPDSERAGKAREYLEIIE